MRFLRSYSPYLRSKVRRYTSLAERHSPIDVSGHYKPASKGRNDPATKIYVSRHFPSEQARSNSLMSGLFERKTPLFSRGLMQLNRLGHFDLCWLVHFRPMTIGARFTVGLALQTGCLVVPDLTPLLTKIRTLIHEEISLPWRTLFPRSSNDPN